MKWQFDPLILGVLGAFGFLYAWAWQRASRREGWPWWRGAAFYVLALGGTAATTTSSLATVDHRYLWVLAVQVTLLYTLLPVAYALGDPVGLARACGTRRISAILDSRPIRFLTFPIVAVALANAAVYAVFFSPLLTAALRHATVMDLLYLGSLATGCLASLPMLGAEMLPKWCSDPVRLGIAFVDGLVDAWPGIAIMSSSFSKVWPFADSGRIAGQAMLALSEAVALPTFFIIFFRWAATETRRDHDEVPDSTTTVPWWIDERTS